MSYGVGTLVTARGREWVVLPGSTEGLLKVRPLGGALAKKPGILTGLERVETASFGLPDPAKVGDFRSCPFSGRRVPGCAPRKIHAIPTVDRPRSVR
jgi:hypothetical protein